MPKPTELDEAEVAAAVEEKRQDALKLAVPQLLQIDREIATKNKRKGEIYDSLAKRGVDKLAFKEAFKRAKKEEDQLGLFDEEAAALEPLIRSIMSGAAGQADRDAAKTAQEAATRQKVTRKDTKPEAAPLPKATKKTAAKKKGAKPSAEADSEGPIRRQEAEVEQPDPDFRRKINRVQAAPDAEGLSADQIPMPGSGERPPQPEPRQAGFVDRTPRMSAKDARKLIGAEDDVLGHG